MRSGIKIEKEIIGDGLIASRGDTVTVCYSLMLNRGDAVQINETTSFKIGGRDVFAGLECGIEGMRVGGQRSMRISPHLGYGKAGVPGKIPSNAVLVIKVELIAVETPS